MDKSSTGSVISMMEDWFKKLPALPPSAVNALVSIAPWLALVFGILGVLSALGALGILTVLAPFGVAAGVRSYGIGFVSTILLGVSSVMMLIAFPGLKAKKLNGWNLLFWSEVVSVVASVIGISWGGVIGALIGFYLLFQIKPKYK